ncbi:MAG: 2-C-methyl-D-erythritol 4-phosphate cytidylyltransferase [Chloroflexi bacterium]|nr:2-C-methyl-D-erythritol 4-phosphate cytidylyltransferase [Chloroflexota bacterium]
MHADAVIVAAGSSTRFGGTDKLFTDLCGRPVLAWSLAAFEAAEGIRRLTVVTTAANIDRVRELAAVWAARTCFAVLPGGARRRDSVEAGLRASSTTYVAIHDGARPLVTPALIAACLAAAEGHHGAIASTPVTDTIKEVDGGIIAGHPDRDRLWAAQTPQVVRREAWLAAAAAGDNDETDDAAMLARFGLEVAVVDGGAENLKITRPLDLLVAAAILRARGER